MFKGDPSLVSVLDSNGQFFENILAKGFLGIKV